MIKSQSNSPLKPRKIWKPILDLPKISSRISLQKLLGGLTVQKSEQETPKPRKPRFSKSPVKLLSSPKRSNMQKPINDFLPELNDGESNIKKKKAVRDAISKKSLLDSIQHLPELLTNSDELVKRYNKAHSEYDPKSYNAKISSIINERRANLKEHILINKPIEQGDAKESKVPSKWHFNYVRKSVNGLGDNDTEQIVNSSFQTNQLSSSMIDNVDQITERHVKNIGLEITDRLSVIKDEKSKLETLLQKASYKDTRGLDFIEAVKEENIEKMMAEITKDPSVISKQFSVYNVIVAKANCSPHSSKERE